MRKFAIPMMAAMAFAAAAAGMAGAAHAETQWQKDHPARTIDNVRLNNQNRRIGNEVRTGQITQARPHSCTRTTGRSARRNGTCPARTAPT